MKLHRTSILASLLLLTLGLTAIPASAKDGDPGACTPGYWKNHTDNWEEVTTSTTLGAIWTFPAALSSFADDTLLAALNYRGGSGVEGATRILLRAAVAAHLNALHDGLGYVLDRGDIRRMVNAALASEDRGTILALAETLDEHNNDLQCLLN